MKRVGVSEAKIGLSGLLSEVRGGEAVLITHHGRPVARIEPCHVDVPDDGQGTAELLRGGVAVPPRTARGFQRPVNRPRAANDARMTP